MQRLLAAKSKWVAASASILLVAARGNKSSLALGSPATSTPVWRSPKSATSITRIPWPAAHTSFAGRQQPHPLTSAIAVRILELEETSSSSYFNPSREQMGTVVGEAGQFRIIRVRLVMTPPTNRAPK
ncbi:hypothetical protein FN846DRAFT_972062 [Sphaerosporella brunnea]|uniref:Uncharacterized protein n=1 Tax=Sphaerosporella brunnea TaxID=1250544 RepID=A0A5J5EJL0_9PEZI|nr:hypothetical protein FN846DRAFT_972062 [Sphaerosporella brunnea]